MQSTHDIITAKNASDAGFFRIMFKARTGSPWGRPGRIIGKKRGAKSSRFSLMKEVGSRRERTIEIQASGNLLIEGALFNDAISRLSPSTFIPKGVYRFRTHEAANQHAEDCLVRGMGLLAAKRS